MDARGRATDLEAILAHSGWVRALAARLVRDPGEADDLAQETLLAAQRRVPEERDGLKPWLARVLRNLAARGRRDRARAEKRERVVARAEALPATDELAANEELRALVSEALVAIPEPFRSTLILRYFGGLEPTEIAKREALPPATVRTRVKRGLELVREELDRRHGGRAAWSAVFVRHLDWSPVPVATGATIAGGMLAMNAGWKVAAGLAAVVLTLSLGWWALESRDPLSPAPEGLSRSTPEKLESLDVEKPAAEVDSAASSRASVAVAAPGHAPASAAPELRLSVIEARTVDSAKRPIAGVTLDSPGCAVKAQSDADGFLRLAAPGTGFNRAWFKKAGWATRIIDTRFVEGETVRLGDVVLQQACVITGRLEDPEGKPLGGNAAVGPAEVPVKDPERVRTLGPGYTDEGSIATTVIANWKDGTFTIDQAAPGVMRLWGTAEGHAWNSTEPFELHAGERRDGVVLKLERLETRDRIGGVVLDPQGKPISQARIDASFEWTEGSTSQAEDTQPDGSFSFVVQARVPHELRITDRQDRWSPLVLSPVQPGTLNLVARFEESRFLELHVRSRDGADVTKFQAELTQAQRLVEGMDFGALSYSPMHEPHSGGIGHVRMPNVPFRIGIDAPGHGLADLGPFDPRTAPERLEIELERMPGIRGRVKLGAGVAQLPVMVELLRAQDGTQKNGYRVLYGSWPTARANANPDGSFFLDLRESGRYWLRAWHGKDVHKDHAPAELGPLELDAHRGADDLVLELGLGGAIEGLVRVPKGENPAGRIVAFNHGDGEPFTLRSDAEGRFRAEHLAPGGWQVLHAPEELTGASTRWSSVAERDPPQEDRLWTCKVRAGETTRVELDLSEERSGSLDGHLTLAGAAPVGWTVALREIGAQRADGGVTLSGTLEAEGRFHFEFPRGGNYALVFTAPGEPGRTLTLQQYLKLEPGTNNWEKRAALTSLAGGGLPPESPEGVVFEYRSNGEFEARCRILPDAQGKFALPLVLTGKGDIARYQNEAGAIGPTWAGLASFEAREGEPASVQVK